jgi:hypothetical protein
MTVKTFIEAMETLGKASGEDLAVKQRQPNSTQKVRIFVKCDIG